MNRSPSFHKLPECDRCLFYTSEPQLHCPVHPNGVNGETCLDFREDPTAIHRWSQFLGLDWVSGENLIDCVLPHDDCCDD